MDNDYNQQTNGNPYQQPGNPYQQPGNLYQQQGNPYYQQQGNFYQQGDPYMGSGFVNYGSNAEPQKAPNIFQQFILAFVPTKYDRLTRVKIGSMILLVTLLVFVSTVISFVNHIVSAASIDVNMLVDQMPDFTITDGHLDIEEDFLYEEDNLYVYITDDVEGFSFGDAAWKAADGYRDIILAGRDRVFILHNRGKLRYQYVNFNTFGRNKQLSKEQAFDVLVPIFTGLLIILYIITFVGRSLGYFLFAAFYLPFAMLIDFIMKKRLETGVLFRMAVYAKVLMFVVTTVLELSRLVNFFVFSLFFFLLRAAITICLMALGIEELPDNRPAPIPMGPRMGQGWQ